MDRLEQARKILKQVWGFDSFREGQEDLILSVLSGKHTIAVLPTGFGKSLGYQLPALLLEGLCIVITPLIALMQDQEQKLKELKIPVATIHSGLSGRQIDIILDNCIYGNTKLLYISPERLTTQLFRSRLEKMNVSFLAVDEAHCISQGGHDFRPSYQKISSIKSILGNIPILALTATATEVVINDIKKSLEIESCQIIKRSFRRKNLKIQVVKTDRKFEKLTSALIQNNKSGIIYVRHRKTAYELYESLKNDVSCDYYHAGLNYKERQQKQSSWLSGEIDMIIATNAFGMGIDKSNVRKVIHYGISPSIEEYYQEIGRAGRDEKNANTIVIYSENDINRLVQSHEKAYPPITDLKKAYSLLYNYYEIPIGQGEFRSLDFDINHFSKFCGASIAVIYRLLKQLEKSSFISLSSGVKRKETIKLLVDRHFIFELNGKYKDICIYLLRNIENISNSTSNFNTKKVAKEMEIEHKDLVQALRKMNDLKFLTYSGSSEKPFITFLQNRFSRDNIMISESNYLERKNTELERNQGVINYLKSHSCRMQFILNYFGESSDKKCGNCDNCLSEEFKRNISPLQLENLIKSKIKNSVSIKNLIANFDLYKQERILNQIHQMIDDGKLHYRNNLIHSN